MAGHPMSAGMEPTEPAGRIAERSPKSMAAAAQEPPFEAGMKPRPSLRQEQRDRTSVASAALAQAALPFGKAVCAD